VISVEKKKMKKSKCRMCGARVGVIRKYGLNICRRCFKESAPKLGFKKFD